MKRFMELFSSSTNTEIGNSENLCDLNIITIVVCTEKNILLLFYVFAISQAPEIKSTN